MRQASLSTLLCVYFGLSIATLVRWDKKDINTVTGDEPHYLVMANGIAEHGALEQTVPYKEEFKKRAIYKPGFAPYDAEPSPQNTHTTLGPNGLFNVHNVGLPLLLSMPFKLGGVLGSKFFMILLGALFPVFAWKFALRFPEGGRNGFWAVIAATIALPLISASAQVYPDAFAGVIALVGLYWFFTAQETRTPNQELLLAGVIVFLPWLHVKHALVCLVLILSVAAKIYLDSKDLQRILRIALVAAFSFAVLALYQRYAFGNVFGPYHSHDFELSKTSLMVLLGLFFDQNQGFLLQNPINLIGIFAIGGLCRFNRPFALLWGLVLLTLLVPNCLHPNWYGGGSFSGRFSWAAGIVFVVPTLLGLLALARHREKVFQSVVAGSALLQIYFFYKYALAGVRLYNRGSETLFDVYSIYFSPIHSWFPMLYNSGWAFGYPPNYGWLVLTCVLLLAGFIRADRVRP